MTLKFFTTAVFVSIDFKQYSYLIYEFLDMEHDNI